jgi:hypothetical protein
MIVEYVSKTPRYMLGLKKRRQNDGKYWSPPPQRFDDNGRLRVDESTVEGKEIIDYMENDPLGRFNVEYWRMSDNQQNIMADHYQEGIAHIPAGEIDSGWYEKIDYLMEKVNKEKFVPAETAKIVKTTLELMEFFDVHGVRRPKETDSDSRVKLCVADMLEVFKEFEITTVKNE